MELVVRGDPDAFLYRALGRTGRLECVNISVRAVFALPCEIVECNIHGAAAGDVDLNRKAAARRGGVVGRYERFDFHLHLKGEGGMVKLG